MQDGHFVVSGTVYPSFAYVVVWRILICFVKDGVNARQQVDEVECRCSSIIPKNVTASNAIPEKVNEAPLYAMAVSSLWQATATHRIPVKLPLGQKITLCGHLSSYNTDDISACRSLFDVL
jgi:hypothetical protein